MSWPTAETVVRRARADIGLGETPSGSNRNKITSAYGLVGPWCAMAVWYWFRPDVDLRVEYTRDWAWTPSAVAAGKRRGEWHPGTVGMRAGDIVFFKLSGDNQDQIVNHVGLALSAPNAGEVHTLDGNTNDVVAERYRSASKVVGYIRPPYGGSVSSPVPPVPPPPAPPRPAPVAPPFPGRNWFHLGAYNSYVTQLDRQLIRLGATRHHDGNGYQAGPRYTTYTRDNVRDVQRKLGWSGTDADGYPGPETWRHLFTLPDRWYA